MTLEHGDDPTPVEPTLPFFPLFALVVTLVVGALVFAYAATHYHRLPEQVPIHFGGSGEPDAWAPRSFSSVMLLPIMTVFLGPFMAFMAHFIANARQAIQLGDGGAALAARERFRAVVSNFLSGVSLLVTGMLASLSYGAMQIGLGHTQRLPTSVVFLAVAMGGYVLVGVIVILFKYSSTPMPRAADTKNWKYGLFYINRNDPSIFVENRFGLGYTLNLGHKKGAAGLALFLAGIAGILLMSLFAVF